MQHGYQDCGSVNHARFAASLRGSGRLDSGQAIIRERWLISRLLMTKIDMTPPWMDKLMV